MSAGLPRTRMPRWLPAVAALVVHAAALVAQPSPTAILGRIRGTGSRPIDFHAAAFPDTVYVGQQVTYQVAVLLSEQARGRLRRNPEFLPPELRGLLSYELGTPARVPPRTFGGALAYESHVFQRALFAVTAGALRVPSPQLTYSLPQSSSYFSREDRFVVRAESAALVIRPLPADGRPADFTGAVGVLRAGSRLDGSRARVGDPLVLTVRIEGTGNVRLFPRPAVEVSWASVVAGNERMQVDTTGAFVRGAKEFDYLLTPTRDGAVTLPVIRYPYFDPYRRSYAVAATSPADVQVAAGDLATAGGDDPSEQLPLRPWRHRSTPALAALTRPLGRSAIVLLLMVPLPALAAWYLRRRRRRPARGVTAVPVAVAPVDDDLSPGGTARRTRRALLASLASRLHVEPADLVSRADVGRVLRRRGVTRATTAQVLHCLDDLAQSGFGGHAEAALTADAVQRARGVLEAVDAEAVTHGRTRLWGKRERRTGAFAIIAVAGAIGATATARHAAAQPAGPACESAAEADGSGAAGAAGVRPSPTALELLVGEGVAAYHARRYTTAAQRFGAAAVACPQDADLLVNWGTAAWAASDTVSAVIAWQRAARLDPLAADVQVRMALLPAGARSGLAAVPMVPVAPLMGLAIFAWCLAWLLGFVAWRSPGRRRHLEAMTAVLLLGAVAAALTARWGRRALDGSGLAVIRRPETLRGAPGFDAGTVGGVSTGDVVRLRGAQEGWFRVSLTDGRDGWLPASRLAPLLADTPIR